MENAEWKNIKEIVEQGKLDPNEESWKKLEYKLTIQDKESTIRRLSRWVAGLSAAAILLFGIIFIDQNMFHRDKSMVYTYSNAISEVKTIDNSALYDVRKVKGLHKAYN